MTSEQFAFFFTRELTKTIEELRAYENDEAIWTKHGEIKNSAGHLSQHLVGNLRTYICRPLGGFAYTRDRDAEFSKRTFDRPELVRLLNETLTMVRQSLAKLDAKTLSDTYPADILTLEGGNTVDFVLTSLLSHVSYHTGQINYHRRLIPH